MRSSRLRRTATAVASIAAVIALAACGGSSDEGGEAAGGESSGGGAYPVTIATKFGDITLTEAPQRIVALGWGDAETAIALGFEPVGTSDWLGFGEDNNGVGPWSKGFTTKPTFIETLEPSFEAIGALEPDLILDTKSSGDQARYDALKEITPNVLGVPEGGDSYLTTTEQQTTMISEALGVPEKGDELLAGVDKAFADAAAAHPDWKGKTASAATRTSEGWGAYIEGSNRVEFLEKLGFVQDPEVGAIPANAGGFSVDISSEQLDVLDADLIVAFPIFIETTQITEDPLWKQIPAVAAGHALVIEGDVSNAYSLGTPESTEFAIEQLTPQIQAALGS